MNTPLYNKLLSIGAYPLHMPGHKRRFLNMELSKLDLTEITDTDNLHNPSGVIMQAQQLMAEAVGADISLFCVNGGSSGILSAILGVCSPNDRLLTVKNAHKSIYNGIILSGCKSAFISPEITPYGICGGISIDQVEKALGKFKDIKAVLVVSPTYEGFVSDIKGIADMVHKYNKILIVDETHGSHFPFSNVFPDTAISCGADISINSWHKTLPALGQSAIININGSRVNFDHIKMAHSMVNTTSPSYMLMGIMDYTRGYITEHKEFFENYTKILCILHKRLNTLKTFEDAAKLKGQYGIFDYDISKITLFFNNSYSSRYIENALLKNNLQTELIDNIHLIAITSVADDTAQLEGFYSLINKLDNTNYINNRKEYKKDNNIVTSELRKYFYMKKTEIETDNAIGKISGDFITPFPPDIPIIIPGQAITQEHINFIKNSNCNILGIRNNKISVLTD